MAAIDTDELLDLAIEEWSERLAGLTGDELAYGLSVLKSEWPPTPMDFLALCTNQDDAIHNTAAYKPFERNADKKRIQQDRDKSIGRKALDEMRGKK